MTTQKTLMTLDLFQIARIGASGLYRDVEQRFSQEGKDFSIREMVAKPLRISGEDVVWEFALVEWTDNKTGKGHYVAEDLH